MQNPFEILERRLQVIEELLVQIVNRPQVVPPAPASDDDMMSKMDAAALLGCCISTIDNAARAGKLTSPRL